MSNNHNCRQCEAGLEAEQTVAAYFEKCLYSVPTELCFILSRFGSDKGNLHNFSTLYFQLWNNRRYQIRSIFELGIGTNFLDVPSNMGIDGIPGASLRAWHEFFPMARVVGADIDRRILFQESGIETYYCDQRDVSSISQLWSHFSNTYFDIIIEDGLHEFSANETFFTHSISRLRKGGFYIIEDIDKADRELAMKFVSAFKEVFSYIEYLELPDRNLKPDNNLLLIIK